ncbi:MAG TPA: thioredoxin family protein [Flavitalea sp.]|nr:thioredoxin family protein [Flavitalea sp.]
MARPRKKYRLFLLILILCGATYSSAQTDILLMAKADSAMDREARPLLILVSTEWCRYCQMQKNQLRKNKDFQAKKNLFYFVEFDAESKEMIRFRGEEYRYRPTGASSGIHTLALALNGSEHIAFPTWVLLDRNYQVLFRYNGVLSPKQLKELLQDIDKIN